jgi:hypothetical protein
MKVDLRPTVPVYTALECDNLSLKLPRIPIRQTAVAATPTINLGFTAITDVAAASTVFIDDVILSDMEP